MEKYMKLLKKSKLFSGLSEENILSIPECLSVRITSYEKGGCILRAGTRTDSMGLLLSGKAIIVQEDFWGNRNVMSIISEGQTFAEVYACTSGSVLSVSVYAEQDSSVLFLDVQQLLKSSQDTFPEHAVLTRNLLADLAAKNLRLSEKVTHMSKRTTRDKLLSYLSQEAERSRLSTYEPQSAAFTRSLSPNAEQCSSNRKPTDTVEFDIPYNRQQLADYLGVDRSGLSNELSRLQGEGLIEFHRSHFVLKSRDIRLLV